jgi:hypothetical protein
VAVYTHVAFVWWIDFFLEDTMKLYRMFAAAALFLLLEVPTQAHGAKPEGEEAIIEEIRAKFKETNDALASFRKVEKEVAPEDQTGGKLEAYYKGDELRKLVVTIYSEYAPETDEFYVSNGSVFFMFAQKKIYPAIDAKAPSMVEENRYYFSGKKLIRWLDTDKKKIANTHPEYKNKEKEILEAYSNYVLMRLKK